MARFTVTLAVIFSHVLLSHLPDTGGAAAAAAFRHQQDDGDLAVAVPIPLEEGPRAVGSGISAVAEFRDPKEDGDLTYIPLRFIEEHGAVGSDVSLTLRCPRGPCQKGHQQDDGDLAVAVPIPLEEGPRAVGSGISAVAEFRDPKEDGDRTSIPVRFIEEHGAVGSDVSRFVSHTLRPRRPCHKVHHRDRPVALEDFPRNLPERLAGDGGFRGWMPREEPLKVFRGHEEKKGKMFGKHEDTDGERFPKHHHHHHHRREGKQEGGIGRWFRKFLQEQF